MENISARVNEAAMGMIEKLGKERMFKLQGDMHRCSAKCCDTAQSMGDVDRCSQRCMEPFSKVQGVLAAEMERFEARLNRCAQDCQDKARDKVQSGSENESVRRDMEKCVIKCADSSIELLPDMYKRLSSQLKDIHIPK